MKREIEVITKDRHQGDLVSVIDICREIDIRDVSNFSRKRSYNKFQRVVVSKWKRTQVERGKRRRKELRDTPEVMNLEVQGQVVEASQPRTQGQAKTPRSRSKSRATPPTARMSQTPSQNIGGPEPSPPYRSK